MEGHRLLQSEGHCELLGLDRKFKRNLLNSPYDRRLHLLATSIRGAVRNSFSNGQSKSIMYDLVSLVRTSGLCDDHNIRFNVYMSILEFGLCL